jgi:uncharacterized protein YukE
MKKISKAQIETLGKALRTVRDMIDGINTPDALDDAQALAQEVSEQITEYVDARSEKWAEGDAASAYQDWVQKWEDLQGLVEAAQEAIGNASDALSDLDTALEEIETEVQL